MKPAESWEGIVVGRLDQGESDRIVRLLSPEHGLCSVWVRNARRARSPGAGLDLGARVRVGARRGRGELWNLAHAEVLDPRLHVRGSLPRTGLAAWACELTAALATRDHAEPRLYGLLETALLLLDASEATPHAAFQAGLEGKALTFAGVAPVLDRCQACARPLHEDMVLCPEAGGVHHPDDVPADALRPLAVRRGLLLALEGARRRPLRDSLDLDLPDGPDVYGEVLVAQLRRELPARTVLPSLLGVG